MSENPSPAQRAESLRVKTPSFGPPFFPDNTIARARPSGMEGGKRING